MMGTLIIRNIATNVVVGKEIMETKVVDVLLWECIIER